MATKTPKKSKQPQTRRAKEKGFPFYPLLHSMQETFSEFNRETYKTEKKVLGLPVITLPAGTVLFRAVHQFGIQKVDYEQSATGIKVTDIKETSNRASIFSDYFGRTVGKNSLCISPTHNTFFYAHPFVGFGIHGVGKTLDVMEVCVLVHSVNVVSMISPSEFVRGTAHVFRENSPIARCNQFNFDCEPERSLATESALAYDNCLNPSFQKKSGVRGWMAIANLDSIEPRIKKRIADARDAELSMKNYLLELDKNIPGKAAEMLTHLYKDRHNHNGFPEIALYPYKEHPGSQKIKRFIRDERDAQIYLYEEAKKNNLNYLPLAVITKDGTTDMVNNLFNAEAFTVKGQDEIGIGILRGNQISVEKQLNSWMTKAMEQGVDLPYYGNSKLVFDIRTGFFVLDKLIPTSFSLPYSDRAKDQLKAKGKDFSSLSYSLALWSLDTEEKRRRALIYRLFFRNYLPERYLTSYGLDKNFGALRAFVFDRPPVLRKIFEFLNNLKMPEEYRKWLGQAAKTYQQETGIMPKKKEALPEPTTALPKVQETVTYQPSTPVYQPSTPVEKPEQKPKPGAFTIEDEEEEETSKGGARQTRRNRKTKAHFTRRLSSIQKRMNELPEKPNDIAPTFQKIWAMHGQMLKKRSPSL